ncbi:hypothetical protein [Nocardioides sp. 503]|uniref:hypothetical protein n=1 Tax=Nocardioides sp. 503 TaxID=2508326 RepID=UPI00142F6DB8|nr:hypothetical protein [Nocardioides sp. 503]
MRVPVRVQVLAYVPVVDDAAYARLVEWWVGRCFAAWQRVTGVDPVADPRVWVEWAVFSEGSRPAQSTGVRKVTANDLRRFHGAVGRGRGSMGMGVHGMNVTDHPTMPREFNLGSTTVAWESVCVLDAEFVVGPYADDGQIELCEEASVALVRGLASQHVVWFANVTDDNPSAAGDTALDSALGQNSRRPTPRLLPGYSWVTFLTPQVLEVLGGVESVEASGVFVSVEPVGGGALVRATERLQDFAGPVVRRVRDAVAAVLPEGRAVEPEGFPSSTTGLRIAWDNGVDGPVDYGADNRYFQPRRPGVVQLPDGSWVRVSPGMEVRRLR